MYYRNYINIFIALIVTVILSSCMTTRVYSDKIDGHDYAQYNTYAWLPIVDTGVSSVYHNEIVEQNLMEAVNREMQTRNYSIDTSNPDLLVLMHLQISQEQKTVARNRSLYGTYDYYYPGYRPVRWNSYYYPGYTNVVRISGPTFREVEYTEGRVFIDVINRSTNELIWRGWSREAVNPEMLSSDLTRVVSEIFEEYPVPPRGRQ